MAEFWLELFKEDWGTKAAIFVLVITLPALVGALYHRKAPDLGDLTLVVFGSATALSGVKILILMVCAQSAQFGPLSDDKPALLLGSLAALVVGVKETLQKWGKVADP